MRIERQAARRIHSRIGDSRARPRGGRRVADQLPAAFVGPTLSGKIDAVAIFIRVAHELIDLVLHKARVVHHPLALFEPGELVLGVVQRSLEVVCGCDRLRADDVPGHREAQSDTRGGFLATHGDRDGAGLDLRPDPRIVYRIDPDITIRAATTRGDQVNRGEISVGNAVDPVEYQRTAAANRRAALHACRNRHRRCAAL